MLGVRLWWPGPACTAASSPRCVGTLIAEQRPHRSRRVHTTRGRFLRQERRGDAVPPDMTACIFWLKNTAPRLLPAKRNAGTGLLLEVSKLLRMLLVIGSAWSDDDGRIHPKCVEESNTRRCWVERPATPPPADHGALVPVRPPPSPQSSLPLQSSLPPPSSVRAPQNRRPPLIFRFGPLDVRIR